MTAGELKRALEDAPEDREIRVFGDPEGNVRWGLGDVYTNSTWDADNEDPAHEQDVRDGVYGPGAEAEDFDNVVLIVPKHL